MTYKEFMLACDGHEQVQNQSTVQAWLTASLNRSKKIPPVSKLIRKRNKVPSEKLKETKDFLQFDKERRGKENK